jgi:hypothetical protein
MTPEAVLAIISEVDTDYIKLSTQDFRVVIGWGACMMVVQLYDNAVSTRWVNGGKAGRSFGDPLSLLAYLKENLHDPRRSVPDLPAVR